VISSVCHSTELFEGALSDKGSAEEEIQGVLGLGALLSSKPYIGVDEDVIVVPIVLLEYKNFFIDGKQFGYYFYKGGGDQIKHSWPASFDGV